MAVAAAVAAAAVAAGAGAGSGAGAAAVAWDRTQNCSGGRRQQLDARPGLARPWNECLPAATASDRIAQGPAASMYVA